MIIIPEGIDKAVDAVMVCFKQRSWLFNAGDYFVDCLMMMLMLMMMLLQTIIDAT